jgi:putative ubiquitin-RnfH superfamily antitoxin RatB of RatAB toxin-antitoxin module
MKVEVVSARPDGATVVRLTLPAGATVRDALVAAKVTAESVGIFGRRVSLETKLSEGDRVEIYRPLAIDPKEARRRRAGSKQRR